MNKKHFESLKKLLTKYFSVLVSEYYTTQMFLVLHDIKPSVEFKEKSLVKLTEKQQSALMSELDKFFSTNKVNLYTKKSPMKEVVFRVTNN